MAKIKDLKEQHPALNITVIDMLKLIDPSDTNKFYHFSLSNCMQKPEARQKPKRYLSI
jgi:hypothetical protein